MAFIHPNKPANLLAMDARTRYEYFVRKVVDFEAVWLLEDGVPVSGRGGGGSLGRGGLFRSSNDAVCFSRVAGRFGRAGDAVCGVRCAVFPNGDGDAVSCALRQ